VFLWPLLEYSRPLPDREPDPRPTLDRVGEQLTSLFQIVADIKEAVDLRAVLGPLLNLVKGVIVRAQRVVGLFGGRTKCSVL
jgi:hypothetical protein